jgi:hypothetical protein
MKTHKDTDNFVNIQAAPKIDNKDTDNFRHGMMTG